jgi:hypothetical protein
MILLARSGLVCGSKMKLNDYLLFFLNFSDESFLRGNVIDRNCQLWFGGEVVGYVTPSSSYFKLFCRYNQVLIPRLNRDCGIRMLDNKVHTAFTVCHGYYDGLLSKTDFELISPPWESNL